MTERTFESDRDMTVELALTLAQGDGWPGGPLTMAVAQTLRAEVERLRQAENRVRGVAQVWLSGTDDQEAFAVEIFRALDEPASDLS